MFFTRRVVFRVRGGFVGSALVTVVLSVRWFRFSSLLIRARCWFFVFALVLVVPRVRLLRFVCSAHRADRPRRHLAWKCAHRVVFTPSLNRPPPHHQTQKQLAAVRDSIRRYGWPRQKPS